MAGPTVWTEELIEERLEKGRGQGDGASYQPWLLVQEFSSRGTQTRVPGLKVGRTHHTFSYLERAFLLLAEFQPAFVDLREQFPMDRGITLGAAKALGIKHPRYPKTRCPLVMTLDAVVTMKAPSGGTQLAAWDVKPANKLKNPRVLEKLSLHKAYCAHIGIPHSLFTEASYSRQMVRNIDWIRMGITRADDIPLTDLGEHPEHMLEQLSTCRRAPVMTEFCAKYDKTHSLEPGTGLRIMKGLLWKHLVTTDLCSDRIELALVRPASKAQERSSV